MGFLKMFGFGRKQCPKGQGGVNDTVNEIVCDEVKEEADGNYILHSAEDMYWLAMMVNEKGYNFSGKIIRLGNDIDFKGLSWTPVGNSVERAFSGVFDGGGHCITGMSVSGNNKFAGLFGVITGINKLMTAEVYNLRLSSVSVKSGYSGAFVGGVAGYAYEGVRVEKCLVGGMVEGKYCVGGICGKIEDCVTVRRCAVRGKVGGGEYAGAIVGKMQMNSTVINCINAASDLSGRPEEQQGGEWDETSLIK